MKNNQHFKEWESVVNFMRDYCNCTDCKNCAFDNKGLCHSPEVMFIDNKKLSEAKEIIYKLQNQIV